jgi:4'-phosphopantetheinyl transferase
MIVCYYKEVANTGDREEIKVKISQLPTSIAQKALEYTDARQQLLFVAGRLLLAKALEDTRFSLADVSVSDTGRPYINNEIDLNISHAGEVVVCAISNDGRVGVDVEEVKEVDREVYRNLFSREDWYRMADNNDFFKIWVRKEALLKCIGNITIADLSDVSVSAGEIMFNGAKYFFKDIFFADGYKAAICCDHEIDEVKLIRVV